MLASQRCLQYRACCRVPPWWCTPSTTAEHRVFYRHCSSNSRVIKPARTNCDLARAQCFWRALHHQPQLSTGLAWPLLTGLCGSSVCVSAHAERVRGAVHHQLQRGAVPGVPGPLAGHAAAAGWHRHLRLRRRGPPALQPRRGVHFDIHLQSILPIALLPWKRMRCMCSARLAPVGASGLLRGSRFVRVVCVTRRCLRCVMPLLLLVLIVKIICVPLASAV